MSLSIFAQRFVVLVFCCDFFIELGKIVRARVASGIAKRRIKEESLRQARLLAEGDIGTLSKRDIFMLGLGLYVGEGSKTSNAVRLSNSNPAIMRFSVRWFIETCGLAKENLRIRMHLYPDSDENVCKRYWSKITGLPLNQFQRTSFDVRTGKKIEKRGKLPYGTVHLSVRSISPKPLPVSLFKRIMAWIEVSLK